MEARTRPRRLDADLEHEARGAVIILVGDNLVNRPDHSQALLPAELDEVREDLLERVGRPTSG
jgi:hypothetical protein